MKKTFDILMNRKIQVLSLLLAFLVSCAPQPLNNPNPINPAPQEAVDLDPEEKGPWDGAIYSATSSDGINFSGKVLLFERSGVPNLLKLQNGDMVLLYQYFSNTDENLFDTIAYSISKNSGLTWTDTTAINFENLPDPQNPRLKPMDPAIVQLEDGRLRLYFTYHTTGSKTPALYSATTSDDNITSSFIVNPSQALITDKNLLDPAVTYFAGAWHHFTWQDGSDNNYHSISDDGLTFTMQEEISLPMEFLGQVVTYEDGLRFYGTGKGMVASAISADGYNWEMESDKIVQGADPAVQQLADGTYLMVYTSMNFN